MKSFTIANGIHSKCLEMLLSGLSKRIFRFFQELSLVKDFMAFVFL